MDKLINTLRAVIVFTFLLLVLIFCFQNRQEVDVKFLSVQINNLPLFIALIGILATGLLIGFLVGLMKGSKTKKRENEREKAAKIRPAQDRAINTERKNETEA